jgi:hypothetical protein
MPIPTDLIGTWRLAALRRWDPDGRETHPIGARPVGYAVFDTTGRAFFQISRNPDGTPTESRPTADDVVRSFMAYCGRYTLAGDQLSVAVETGNNPADIGTTQTRTITLAGDTLTIGTPGRFAAELRRVR